MRKPLSVSKRQEDTDVPLYDVSEVSYLVELSIGTPGQSVKVAVDTGSSELWVDPVCQTSQSLSQVEECIANGIYDPYQSDTFEDLNSNNTIPYGIGIVQIEYGFADPSLAINLTDVQFGVATASRQLNEGIMGLSFGGNTPQADLNYNNIVDELYLQNATQSRAFSVALGSSDSDNDSVVIFGGIDTSKYAGPLRTLSILGPQNGETIYRYWVQLDSIGSTVDGSSHTYDNSSLPVVLDTGSTFCSLPRAVVSGMMEDLGGQIDSQGQILVDCSQVDNEDTFDFDFGNITIRIPYAQFVVQANSEVCVLGAIPDDQIALLGDSFLRSAYVVFDQNNMEVAMAPFANCGQSEQRIPDEGVSGVEGACDSANSDGRGGSGDGDDNAGSRLTASMLGLLSACISVPVFVDLL
ncbi:hypothetical protein DL764_003928 [Monosporascus ibericus]|uniref:Peptidase A1 domain-containing protein n=1 Tax=Monosporascus ibericus TaxID=155417 RepID=A0A4Q4TI68_9PEZI|nr:hypothetical protein DL764_003928 [Monosporascus ibericus]